MHVAITSMSHSAREPNARGTRILAHFDFDHSGLRVHECALVRTAEDHLIVWSPRAIASRRPGTLTFLQRGLRQAVRDAAWRAYVAMVGPELDWKPVERLEKVPREQ